MSYAIYRATFDDGTDELVKAEDFSNALALAIETYRPKSVVSFTLVRVTRDPKENVRAFGEPLRVAESRLR